VEENEEEEEEERKNNRREKRSGRKEELILAIKAEVGWGVRFICYQESVKRQEVGGEIALAHSVRFDFPGRRPHQFSRAEQNKKTKKQKKKKQQHRDRREARIQACISLGCSNTIGS
jgi:hypothetical protein